MGRVVGFVLVVCLLAGAAMGGWWWWEQRKAVAAGDALPALTRDDATRAYLSGEGRVVREMFDITPRVVADEGTCGGRVTSLLPEVGSPTVLSQASTRVPDPTARDLALAHVGLLGDYAASCKDGARTEALGKQLLENKATFETLMVTDGGDR